MCSHVGISKKWLCFMFNNVQIINNETFSQRHILDNYNCGATSNYWRPTKKLFTVYRHQEGQLNLIIIYQTVNDGTFSLD